MRFILRLSCLIACLSSLSQAEQSKIQALIIDGRNNHDWCSTTDFLRATLEASGLFEVNVSTAPQLKFPRPPRKSQRPEDAEALEAGKEIFKQPQNEARESFKAEWEKWSPDFSRADVVILNYNGDTWPSEMARNFIEFIRNGGGTVLIHGSNNAFRTWPEFNELIGIGWRPAPVGQAIKVDPETGKKIVANDSELPNKGNSSHGSKHPFQITVRDSDHPIMRGVPKQWMHAKDELYHNMRGPAKNLTVLSSAYSDPEQRGSGLHEPMTWEVQFGKGRAVVTSMGHLWGGDMERAEQGSLQCAGFQTIFARSCEYAATGTVTLPIPHKFPGPDEVSTVPANELSWNQAANVDNLNLPRAIQPLGDGWIAIRETDTMDVIAYRDTDSDGIADENKILYQRGPVGRNSPDKSVEHQDSGLQWNIDNYIYITYNSERYRFTDGEWKAEKQPDHWTQWGLTHDNDGNLYWSTNSDPVIQAHIHPRYWNIPRNFSRNVPRVPVVLPKTYPPTFMSVASSCLLNDRGGSAPAVRGFTSACGQSVYRADKFPAGDRGTYYVCDPTIHVVRRARLSRNGGLASLARMEPEGSEFLRSSDINCRFINTAEGPDGCLYITDMYRGIIQDAPWLNPQARENIQKAGLDDNNQHGRIWRIRHKDFEPRSGDALPGMNSESTLALLRHLEHTSGWWRDTAQREIILRDDRDSVVPHLKALAMFADYSNPRFHALWTLEGMDQVDTELLAHMARDREPRIRRAAVQIAESKLGEETTFDAVVRPLIEDRDPRVAKQLILSLGLVRDHPDGIDTIQRLARQHSTIPGVQLATTLSLWGMKDLPLVKDISSGKAFDPATNAAWKNMIGNWDRGLKFPDDMSSDEKRRITGGETFYFATCVSCHGADGRGMKVPGTDTLLAPSLYDSARVRGDAMQLIPIFLHGLMGPIEGKTYSAGFMAPAHALGITREDRLSELITYLRFVHGEGASSVSHHEVKAVKRKYADRKTPWTDQELKQIEGSD